MAKTRVQLICGEDDYLVAEKAKALVDAWVPEAERVFGLEIVDGRADTVDGVVTAVNRCIEALQTVGFFGGGKTVWLRDAEFLAGGGRSFDSETVKDKIASLTDVVKAGLPEGQSLLISARAVPRNSALFKALQAAGEVVNVGTATTAREKDKVAQGQISSFLERFGLEMSEPVRVAFLARVGNDTRTLLQELEKLCLYLGSSAKVTTADIEAVTSVGKEAEAWDLTDALGERDRLKMMRALRRLEEQGEAAIKLAAMLDGRIRDLILMRAAVDGGWVSVQGNGAVWRDVPHEAEMAFAVANDPRKQHPWRAARLVEQARKYTMNELRAARHYLMEMRESLVSTALDESFLMETTLLKIVGMPRVRPKR